MNIGRTGIEILKRLKERFNPIVENIEWDGETGIYKAPISHISEITTGQVSVNVQLICPNCNYENFLRNGKCWKCDLGGLI
jgi:hypothetical protein